jgi:NACHT domain
MGSGILTRVSVESVIAKASAQAAKYVGAAILNWFDNERLARKIRHPVSQPTIAGFLVGLRPATATELYGFFCSAQLDFLANQVQSWQITGWNDDQRVKLLHDIRGSLGRIAGLDQADVLVGAEIILQVLAAALAETTHRTGRVARPEAASVVTAMACEQLRDSDLVAYLRDLAAIDQFSTRLRAQVAALRSTLRLTHLASGPVTGYDGLYVEPAFDWEDATRSFSIHELFAAYSRLVVLGDPGAGKSTFAEKLTLDLATDRVPGFAGKVPFLLIVRDYADAPQSGRTLDEWLYAASRNPYHVTPPDHGLEYLLESGNAVVIVDGVDELGTPESRHRFVDLIEGFAYRYPTTQIVVTSRIVGYDDAPLDPRHFPRARIRPFSVAQCEQYARKWFAIDKEATAVQQERLAQGLITETDPIDDLRRNPLLLSLLCSLYSSKHYIPRHRTEIYEQCAELLFERWDRRREISVPLKYMVDVRPAIAELAWKLFCDPSRRQVMRKREILDFLTHYLREERYATDHEAVAAAQDFLAFCAGRAWVLTEIGTANHEPLYGFTHATFLEYFAALQLVRQEETIDATWQALRPRVGDASWSVVSELAVQILDRNSHGGVNRFVGHLIGDDVKATEAVRLGFAVRLTCHLTLNNMSIESLCLRAIDRSCAVPAGLRRRFLDPGPRAEIRAIDQPLSDLMLVSLPENASRVASYVVDALLDRSAEATDLDWDENTPDFLLGFLRTFSRQGNETAGHIAARMRDLPLPPGACKWESLFDARPEDLREHGLRILYEETLLGQVGLASNAHLLLALALTDDQGDAFDDYLEWRLPELYQLMVGQPWPWLTSPASHMLGYAAVRDEIALLAPRVSTERFMRLPRLGRSAALLMLLPYTQLFTPDRTGSPSNIVNLLSFARHQPDRINHAVRMIDQWNLDPYAADLLMRYLYGETSPIAPSTRTMSRSDSG